MLQESADRRGRLASLFVVLIFVILIGLLFLFKTPLSDFFNEHLGDVSLPFNSVSNASVDDLKEQGVLQSVPLPESLDVYLSENKTFHSQKFPYVLHGDESYLVILTQEELSNYFFEQPRSISNIDELPTTKDLMMKNIGDSLQGEQLIPIVDDIRSRSDNKSEQARIAISFVQLIPYDLESYYADDLHGRFAYEVLHDAKGVCGEKSELLVFLLKELDFDVAIFNFEEENHQAVGIACSSEFDFKNSGYCFVETTQPTIITTVPNNYVGVGELLSTPEIVEFAGEYSLEGVSREYFDAQRLAELHSLGPVLEKADYDAWVSLVNQYRLFVA